MSKLLFYKYHTIDSGVPYQYYCTLWADRVWKRDTGKGWEPIGDANEAKLIRFVKEYPEHYEEVSALEVLVVCGTGPWDQ